MQVNLFSVFGNLKFFIVFKKSQMDIILDDYLKVVKLKCMDKERHFN